MAVINIIAMHVLPGGGPDLPSRHRAWLTSEDLFDTKLPVPVLRMILGDCQLRVWPADAEYIAILARELQAIADKLTTEKNTPKQPSPQQKQPGQPLICTVCKKPMLSGDIKDYETPAGHKKCLLAVRSPFLENVED
jgi:hypothetical protein